MAPSIYKPYKVQFSRITSGLRGRSERDTHVERLKRFISEQGMAGELHSIGPSGAFGILEILCTERLARRLSDMSEVEVVLEG
ncbi:hypothetical protein [Azospirillum sp. sgz301742]